MMKSAAVFGSVFAFLAGSAGDSFAAAQVQRRVQEQKAVQAQMVQQYQQQMLAQQQAQAQAAQMAAYKQAVAQQQAAAYQQAYQQAAMQKAAAEYAAYKQSMEMAVARRQAELQAVAQAKQMIAQQQAAQAAQVAAVQDAVARKQMTEVVAFKQAQEVKTYTEAARQAQLNAELGQYAELMVKRKALMAAQAAQYQQAVTEKNLMEAAAYQKAAAMKNRAVATAAVNADDQRRLAARSAAAAGAMAAMPPIESPASAEPETPEVVVDIHELWDALDRSARAWTQIVDDNIKRLTVAEYIDRFHSRGITIAQPPGEYVRRIDALLAAAPDMEETAFGNVLTYAAVVEYDFDNGRNKDELARQFLGEERFQANKRRHQLR